jgi:hypothetical protein
MQSIQRGRAFLPRPLFLIGLLILLLLAAALLAAVWQQPARWQIDLGRAGDETFVANFYQREANDTRSFRWSGPAARLHFAGAGSDPARLRLALSSGALTDEGSQPLRLERAGQPLGTLAVAPGWRVYELYLPRGALVDTAAAGVQAVPLELITPLARPRAGDDRFLGVVVDWVELEPLAAPAAPAAFAHLDQLRLLRVLLLTWGLALAAGALALLATWVQAVRWLAAAAANAPPASLASSAQPALTLRQPAAWLAVYLPTAAGASLLAWWAARDVHMLARALPLTPGLLAWLTLALLGLWLLGALGWVLAQRQACGGGAGRSGRLLPGAALLLALAHLLLLPPLPLEVRGVGALLVLGLPGALLALLVFRREPDAVEKSLLALCGALVLPVLLLLALHALPGALPWWLLLLACDTLSLGLGWLLWRAQQTHPLDPPDPALSCTHAPALLALGLVLLVGAIFRLVALGSAELQGDEARPLLVATGVLYGKDEMLLLRTKGPVESLVPAGPLVLLGQINEWTARLPFALTGLAVLPGCYVLAYRMLCCGAGAGLDKAGLQPRCAGRWVGVLAAALLALDGLSIGFARIVQYQSVVLLLACGALWCGWRFATGAPAASDANTPAMSATSATSARNDPPAGQRYLVSAAVLAAVGLLAHYDGVFVLPALGWLVLWGGWRRGWRGLAWLRGLWLPTLTGALLVALFYVPFFLHEWVSRNTTVYLLWRVRGQNELGFLYNNLTSYYHLATFYNTTFQMVCYSLVLLAGLLVWLLRLLRPRLLAAGLAGLLLLGSVLAVGWPAAFDLSTRYNWALLAFGLPLAALIVAPAPPAALRLLLLWFGAPFVAMAFVIADPRTHFYVMHPAAALLVALAVVQGVGWLAARRWRLARVSQHALAYGALLLLLLTLPYHYLIFLRQTPEYQRSFPAARPPLYAASYGDERPQGGYFGFPFRAGWKVIGQLYEQGILAGSYNSNVGQHLAAWYTRGAFHCDKYPDYIFLSEPQQAAAPRGYTLHSSVLVAGVRKLDMYSRAPVVGPPQLYTLDGDIIRAFDAQPVEHIAMQRIFPVPLPQQRVGARWQGGVLLHGYDLWSPTLPVGEDALIRFYWEAAQPLNADYTLVVELVDEAGQPVRTAEPYCGVIPPASWHMTAATLRGSAFRVPLAAAPLPAGRYRWRVGLRHADGERWLPLAEGGSWLHLPPLEVRPASGVSKR